MNVSVVRSESRVNKAEVVVSKFAAGKVRWGDRRKLLQFIGAIPSILCDGFTDPDLPQAGQGSARGAIEGALPERGAFRPAVEGAARSWLAIWRFERTTGRGRN